MRRARLPAAIIPIITAATLLAACSSNDTTTGTSGASGASSGGAGGAGGGGSCESACVYYLGCKGTDTADNRQLCNQQCAQQGYTAEQLAGFQQLDCATAVCTIENTCQGGSSSGSSGQSKDCFGCQHDGTSCIYVAPGGGASSACDPSCC